jgi:hypothetical protein
LLSMRDRHDGRGKEGLPCGIGYDAYAGFQRDERCAYGSVGDGNLPEWTYLQLPMYWCSS